MPFYAAYLAQTDVGPLSRATTHVHRLTICMINQPILKLNNRQTYLRRGFYQKNRIWLEAILYLHKNSLFMLKITPASRSNEASKIIQLTIETHVPTSSPPGGNSQVRPVLLQ